MSKDLSLSLYIYIPMYVHFIDELQRYILPFIFTNHLVPYHDKSY